MDDAVVRALVDTSGYLGALSAGVAGNAIWDAARSLVHRVSGRFSDDEQKALSRLEAGQADRTAFDLTVSALARVLQAEPDLLVNTHYSATTTISDSIFVINAEKVGDITQTRSERPG